MKYKIFTVAKISILAVCIGQVSLLTSYAASPMAGLLTADALPERWNYTEYFNQRLPTNDGWWEEFNDSLLDSLINIGVRNNYDILMAARRMEIARLSLLETRAGYFPQFDLSAGWSKERTSGKISALDPLARSESYFSLGINMSWQIDLFGKITAESKAKKASWQASQADYAGTMVTLCGNIATAYAGLRVYQAEKEVAMQHLEQQGKVVKITEARFEAGLASMLEVAQAKGVYYSTQASLPSLDASINTSINSLAVLLAIMPSEARAILGEPRGLLPYLQIIRTGIPMDLIRRRPDVIEAEKQLAMYAAEVGIAKKDFLPTLTLDGSIGTSAHDINNLFASQSYTYSIVPTLSWTIFDGLQRKYAVESAKQSMESAISNYNLVLLQAVTEVDNAMCNYIQTVKRIASLEQVVEESRTSLDLSLELYKRGLAAFTNVVDAQMDYLTYTNSVIEAKGQAVTDLINLYEALGGGWDSDQILSLSTQQ